MKAYYQKILTILAAATILVLGAIPSFAQTGLTTTTNMDSLPVNYVYIQNLKAQDAVFSTTNSSIKYGPIKSFEPSSETNEDWYRSVYYQGPVTWGTSNRTATTNASLGNTNVSGSFSLRWNGKAVLSDGTKADVMMTFSEWRIASGARPDGISAAQSVVSPIICFRTEGNNPGFRTSSLKTSANVNNALNVTTCQRIKCTVQILQQGTNTPISSSAYPTMYLRFIDLDVMDASIAYESDTAARYSGTYSEGIGFASGFKSPYYITPNTLTRTQTVDGNLKIRGSAGDEDTLDSGFIAAASPQGFSYYWYGSTQDQRGGMMGTGISTTPAVSVLATAGSGGSIEKPGGTTYPLNGATSYKYTPNRGYAVKSLKVNGAAVTLSTAQKQNGGAYNFAKLTERSSTTYDHTIDVQFAAPELTIAKAIDKQKYHFGDTIHYKVTVKNTVSDTFVDNAVIEDAVTSAGQKYVQGSATCSDSTAQITDSASGFKITVPKISGGQTVTIEYDAKADSQSAKAARATSIANTASVVSNQTAKKTSSARADLKVSVWYVWSGDHPGKALPENGEKIERDPGSYSLSTMYTRGETQYAENVRFNGQNYARGTWAFVGWNIGDGYLPDGGTLDVWKDTKIIGTWYFNPEYNIDTSVVGGTITESEDNIGWGENRVVTYSPSPGYQLKSVTVDGAEVDIKEHPNSYSFRDIDADHTVDVVYEKIPALEIIKEADKTIYNAGDTVTYTIKVKQLTDGAEARGLVIKDTLPEGLTLNKESITGDVTVVSAEDNSYELSVPSLETELTYTYTAVTKKAADFDELINIAEVSGENVPDPARDDAKVGSKSPKPVIEKVISNETPIYGEEVTYWITVTEPQEGIVLRNALIEDPLPAGVEPIPESVVLTGDNATASVSDGVLTIDIPILSESVVIELRAKITAVEGEADNIATLTGDDIDPISDNALITVKEPEPVLTKAASKETAYIGETVNYTVTASSEITLLDAVIKDEIPSGIEVDASSIKCDADDAEVSFDNGIITVKKESLKEPVTISYTGTVVKEGELLNIASLSAMNYPKGPLKADATVLAKIPAYGIAKEASRESLYPSETIEFKVTADLEGVQGGKIEDKLPGGITVDEESINVSGIAGLKGELKDGVITVLLPKEHITGQVVLTYAAVAESDFGLHQNIASLSADNFEEPLLAEAEFEILKPSLSLAKAVDKSSVKVGETVMYTLNAELVGARGAVIEDRMPKGVNLDSDSISIDGAEAEELSVKGDVLRIAFPSDRAVTADISVTYEAEVAEEGRHVNTAVLSAANTEDEKKADATVKGTVDPVVKSVSTGDSLPVLAIASLFAAGIALFVMITMRRKAAR